jgi:hypothetical protein
LALSAPAFADDAPPVRNNYGTVGMVDMPSARMVKDGDLSVGASFFKYTEHFFLGFQFLPWLETSFRYAGLSHYDPNPVYYDRSFAVKVRLANEGEWMPTVAVGINDLVGTGVYSGEYLVASKQFGDIDATLGIGWGRMGEANTFRNPLTLVSKRFEVRPSEFQQIGGQFDFNQFFHGPTSGFFGGIVWHTPIDGLSVVGELSSDPYSLESSVRSYRPNGQFRPKSQINVALHYRVAHAISVSATYMYGTALGLNASFDLDPFSTYPMRIGPVVPEPKIRSQRQQQNALDLMVNPQAGSPAQLAQMWERLNAPKTSAELVDRLMNQGDYDDVQIRGRMLVLTSPREVTPLRCRDAALLLRGGRLELTTVMLQSGAGLPRKSQQCSVGDAIRAQEATYRQVQTDNPDGDEPAFPPTHAASIKAIRADFAKQNISLGAVDLSGSVATVYYRNGRYSSEAVAVGRMTRLLMADTPAEIEKFHFIAIDGGVPQTSFEVLRAPMERSLQQYADGAELADNAISQSPPPVDNPILDHAQKGQYPIFSWSLYPQFRQSLFNITNPFSVQFLAAATADVQLATGLDVVGEVEGDLYNNYVVNTATVSALPHVRTDFVQFFSTGKTGMGELEADYRFKPTPEVWAILRAGYLESMFGGVGGEALWRPENQRWALSIDGYRVWERNFDRLFGFQSYKAFTGHVNLYYTSPWYGLNFALSAGQYLAGDRGVTFAVTRRFASGVEIGAFLTKTNVSAANFGEGSFDKGIIIRIPLDYMIPIQSQGQLAIDLRPIQRDGGQRLAADALLYNETQRISEGEVRSHFRDFAEP